MNLVKRGEMHFYEKTNDISILSSTIASFFKISHEKDLIPLIEELKESEFENVFEADKCFKKYTYWSVFERKRKISEFKINRNGCALICKKIKAKPLTKKEFQILLEIWKKVNYSHDFRNRFNVVVGFFDWISWI